MEAATDTGRAVVPGRQHFHPGHPKAGGNLNGTGTPAFRAGDYGMGAVTDNGTGNYTLALDTAFADTNYWCNSWARSASDAREGGICGAHPSDAKTASSRVIRVATTDEGAAIDSSEIGITFWGAYA